MTASTATPERRHVRELDWLMLAVVGLSCIGLVMAVSVLGPQPRIGGVLQAMKNAAAGHETLRRTLLSARGRGTGTGRRSPT